MRRSARLSQERKQKRKRRGKLQSLTVNNNTSSSTTFGKVEGFSLDSHDPLN